MDTSEHTPAPLFDTLEYLESPVNIQSLQIEQQYPNKSFPVNANYDYRHACNFLYSYRGSAETFKSYRREIERLLQWSWFIQTKSLKDLNRIDFEAFLEFCQMPPKHWIGTKQVPRFNNKDGLRIVNLE